MHDHLSLFTFRLIDGNRATFEGATEKHAFNRAVARHSYAVDHYAGVPAVKCTCAGSKRAQPVREAGFLICDKCAGYFG